MSFVNLYSSIDMMCYALVNHLSDDHAPVVLGLFERPGDALNAFAANFDLKRIENRQSLRFRSKWDTPSPWAIHQIHMNTVHSMGILRGSFSAALVIDMESRVGFVVVEPSQKEKEAAARAVK